MEGGGQQRSTFSGPRATRAAPYSDSSEPCTHTTIYRSEYLEVSYKLVAWSPMLEFLSPRAEYSDSKNPFHANPKCGVRSALPYSVGILLSFGGVIHSTYHWLQYCSLGHAIWATGCRDMINLNSDTMESVFSLLK